jgi:hypothetical protein
MFKGLGGSNTVCILAVMATVYAAGAAVWLWVQWAERSAVADVGKGSDEASCLSMEKQEVVVVVRPEQKEY